MSAEESYSIMTGTSKFSLSGPSDDTTRKFLQHSQAQRVSTDTIIVSSLRAQYPGLQVTVIPADSCNLLAWASAGHATATPVEDPKDPFSAAIKWRQYIPPARRSGGQSGFLVDQVQFGKYMYKHKDLEVIMYVVNGRDGTGAYPQQYNNYILSSEQRKVDELITEASSWAYELHDEIWVYDGGWWQKSAELWDSVQKSEWSYVILPEDMKKSIIDDVEDFFNSKEIYEKLKVPWKRGIIYYGPPGNGKTISIKAMMHSLYKRKDPIPTLYVRSLASYGGAEYAVQEIFEKARRESPCYLVFEDLDSIVTDSVRSYFLNEVDGLKDNDGILMVGSTNHLDRLDDGIAKRPSRFDRKYLFPNPDLDERDAYAGFWQKKLASTPEVEFPDELCPAVAKITDGFSFAYLQEAFVSSLLAIAREGGLKSQADEQYASFNYEQLTLVNAAVLKGIRETEIRLGRDKLDTPLWRELQKQIAILREGIENESRSRRNRKS